MDPELEAANNPDAEGEAPEQELDADYDRRNVHPDNRPQPAAEEGDDDADEEVEGDDEGDNAEPDEDEEEVEHNGKKYKLPKALVAERMMQQDYTRKTTELAEARKAFEIERAQAAEVDEELRADYGRVHAIKATLAEFEGIDWPALERADPAEAQALWRQREQLKEALGKAEGGLQDKERARLQGQQETLAKAMQDTGRILARDIKGFNAQVATEIAKYGIKEFGVTEAEVRQMADPRLWKVLHRLMEAEKTLKARDKARNVEQRQQKLEAVKPAQNVAKKPSAPPTGLDDRLSQKEWLRRRNEQLAKQRQR